MDREKVISRPAVRVLLATSCDGVADGLDLFASDDVTVWRLLSTNWMKQGLRPKTLFVRTRSVSETCFGFIVSYMFLKTYLKGGFC